MIGVHRRASTVFFRLQFGKRRRGLEPIRQSIVSLVVLLFKSGKNGCNLSKKCTLTFCDRLHEIQIYIKLIRGYSYRAFKKKGFDLAESFSPTRFCLFMMSNDVLES
jgi:hypothetical protein